MSFNTLEYISTENQTIESLKNKGKNLSIQKTLKIVVF